MATAKKYYWWKREKYWKRNEKYNINEWITWKAEFEPLFFLGYDKEFGWLPF